MTAGLLERKALSGVSGTKILDEQAGIVECIVSVTGIRDEVKDIIVPNAYEKTLAVRRPKGVSGHDWEKAVAKAIEVKELFPGDTDLPKTTASGEPWPREAGALKVTSLYNLETTLGKDTYSNVKFYGPEQEWSIGYNVPRGGARLDGKAGIRSIDVLDLFEWSDVLFGAAPLTAGTTNVKRLGGIRAGGLFLPDGGIPAEKYLPGTYEERRDMLDDALRMRFLTPPPEGEPLRQWVSIRGTYDDRVVVCVYDDTAVTDNEELYEVEYMIRDGVVDLGTSRTVKIEESIIADPDAADDDQGNAGATEEKTPEGYLSPSEILAAESLWAGLR